MSKCGFNKVAKQLSKIITSFATLVFQFSEANPGGVL